MHSPDLLSVLTTPRAAPGLDAVELEAVLVAIDDRLDAGAGPSTPVLESARRALERDLSHALALA